MRVVTRPLDDGIGQAIVRIQPHALGVENGQHSKARQIEAELIYTRALFKCVVRDNGQGIDPRVLERGRDGHWGLTGMRERMEQAGGELHLRSRPTAGTEIELSLSAPLAYSEIAAARFRPWR